MPSDIIEKDMNILCVFRQMDEAVVVQVVGVRLPKQRKINNFIVE